MHDGSSWICKRECFLFGCLEVPCVSSRVREKSLACRMLDAGSVGRLCEGRGWCILGVEVRRVLLPELSSVS